MTRPRLRTEALEWLQRSKITAPFASNRFQNVEEVAEVIRTLYSLGASLVEVELEDETDYSETMIIHGSDRSEQGIFSFIGSLQPDEVQYERGSFFWRLWWD